MTALEVVFDDTRDVHEELRSLVGVDRFGSVVFRRRSRLEAMREAARLAGASLVHLRTPQDRDALVRRLREDDQERLMLFCPSHLVPVDDDDGVINFLRQIQYAPVNLYVPQEGGGDKQGWALVTAPALSAYLARREDVDLPDFFAERGDVLVDVRDRLRLIDVSDERTLLDFLSGQFDARHFNAIEREEYVVTKRSTDRAKLKREFDFHHLVPPAMQMFLVQPFDFHDDGETASYRMERLSIPDMALQWVHGAFAPAEFERFLRHIFHFVAQRPEKRAETEAVDAAQQALYVDKVESRIAQLKATPEYAALAPLLERGCGGIDALVARYLAMFAVQRKRLPRKRLVIGHGDPCFSNILYSKTNQYLKLIDPRGASSEDELYTDAMYDVAKLSHSVLGGYDFINHDKFDIAVDERLGLSLTIEDPPPSWVRPMFVAQLKAAGFNPALTRLCEASLFISMLPLHIDRPRKALAFALNAAAILDELDGKSEDDE